MQVKGPWAPCVKVLLLGCVNGRPGRFSDSRPVGIAPSPKERDMICWPRASAVAAILGFGAMSLMGIAAHAEPGVFDDRILFGQSAAFEGPAAALGLGMREGILASFNEANAAGGVNGRRLELVSYDDGYEPEKAIANTKRLIGENGVFALIGEVGTPTSNAAQ